IDEAIGKYRQAAKDAIAKAKAIPDGGDKNIRELFKLVGSSYQAMLPALQARMLRLDQIGEPRRQLWVPDFNGRYELRNLHTVVDAIQAQEDYSKLDTQLAMLATAAVTAPFILEEGVLAAAIAWGTDAVSLGVSLANDVPEFIEQREEIHFALGASLILGTQRLREAELRKTEWFQLVVQLGPPVLGQIASTVRMVGAVRTKLLLDKVARGGLEAYKALSEADKAAFWRYATEARLLEELGETKALTPSHRRALATTQKLVDEMGLKVPELPKTKTLAAIGDAGPAPAPKTKTLNISADPSNETIELTEAGAVAGRKSEPAEPIKAPPEQQPVAGATPSPKTATVTYGGAGDPAPRVAPPKANEPWTTIYNGRPRTFQLGNRVGGGQYAEVFEL